MNMEKKVCHCKNVTNGHIKKAIEEGAKTYEEVQEKTGFGKGCKRCVENVKRVVDDLLHNE